MRGPKVLWNPERGVVSNIWNQRRPHRRQMSRKVMGGRGGAEGEGQRAEITG